mgnify:CR=1 FL=1
MAIIIRCGQHFFCVCVCLPSFSIIKNILSFVKMRILKMFYYTTTYMSMCVFGGGGGEARIVYDER